MSESVTWSQARAAAVRPYPSPDVLSQQLRWVLADDDALLDALSELWSWVFNWDPEFIYDDEWDVTEQKVRAALGRDRQVGPVTS